MICKRRVAALLTVLHVSAAMAAVDLEAAAAIVQKKVEGRVLGGKTVEEGGRTLHVIKVLTPDGRVTHIQIDAETGKVVKEPSKGR